MAQSLHHRLKTLEQVRGRQRRGSHWPEFRAFCNEFMGDPIGQALLDGLAQWSMNAQLGLAPPEPPVELVECLMERQKVVQLRPPAPRQSGPKQKIKWQPHN